MDYQGSITTRIISLWWHMFSCSNVYFWTFIAGNYDQIHKKAVWQTTLVRTLTLGIPLAVILILVPKITLIVYLVLPLVSFFTPDRVRKQHRHYRK